jgi:hypothetical protein
MEGSGEIGACFDVDVDTDAGDRDAGFEGAGGGTVLTDFSE